MERFKDLEKKGLNIIYGNTEDIFLTENFKIQFLEGALTDILKREGFKKVIFFNRLHGIHTYDEESYNLFFSKEEFKPNLKNNENDNKEPPKDNRPLGNRRLLKRNKNNEKKQNKSIKLDSLGQRIFEIFPNQTITNSFLELDRILSDKKYRTAVIITEADFSYINQADIRETLYSLISRNWFRLNNDNFVAFVFNSHKDISKLEEYINHTIPALNSLVENKKNIFKIPTPYADENRRLLHFERLINGLDFEWEREEYMIRLLNLLDILLREKKDLLENKIKNSKDKKITLDLIKSLDKSLSTYDKPALEILEELTGLENIKNEIKSYIKLIKSRKERGLDTSDIRLHLVFKGNPGTGKTTVARLIAQILAEEGILKKGHLVECGRQDLIGEHLGGSTKKIIEKVNQALDGVLFIDEAYTLVGEERSNDPYGKEVIETLLKEMEDKKDRLVVIIAGYSNEMDRFIESNPGLKSRFTNIIEFEDYTPQQLKEIFFIKAKKRNLKISKELEENLIDIFRSLKIKKGKDFGNARDVENLLQYIEKNWIKRIGGEGELELQDVPKDLIKIKNSSDLLDILRLENLKKYIVGQDRALKEIIKTLKINLKKSKINKKRKKILASFLLVGPTGVGKTETVKAIYTHLKELDYQYLKFDMGSFSEAHATSTLLGSPRGYAESEEGGALTRSLIKNPRAIILFDELEKGHPSLYKIFMSLLDEGQIQETSTGQIVELSNGLVFFTSNLYQGIIREIEKKIEDETLKDILIKDLLSGNFEEVRNIVNRNIFDREISLRIDERTGRPFMFPPEFVARIDKVILYNELDFNSLQKITKLVLSKYNLNKDKKFVEEITRKYLPLANKQGVRSFIREIEEEIILNL